MPKPNTQELITHIIQRIAVGPDRGKDISHEEAYAATQALLNNELDPVQAAIFLIGLRMKRESIEEYQGIFQALHDLITPINTNLKQLVYLAEPYDGYVRHLPMSPFVPAVLAACGIPCLLQGVRSVGPKHGVTAHQVYAEYGISTQSNLETAAELLTKPHCAWAYLDQSLTIPRLYQLQNFRDRIVKRTALTTLERLIRPINAVNTSLVIGYVHKAYPEIYASIAKQAGFTNSLLIKGIEGGITPALNKPIRTFLANNHQISEKNIDETLLGSTNASGVAIETTETSLAKQTLEAGLEALDGQSGVAFDSLLIASTTIMQQLFDLPKEESKQRVMDALTSGAAKMHFDRIKHSTPSQNAS